MAQVMTAEGLAEGDAGITEEMIELAGSTVDEAAEAEGLGSMEELAGSPQMKPPFKISA